MHWLDFFCLFVLAASSRTEMAIESNRTRTEIGRTEQRCCSTPSIEQRSSLRLDRTESNWVGTNCWWAMSVRKGVNLQQCSDNICSVSFGSSPSYVSEGSGVWILQSQNLKFGPKMKPESKKRAYVLWKPIHTKLEKPLWTFSHWYFLTLDF